MSDPGGIVCVIPARSGSKGIPGKNLTEFHGKPMLAWSIEAARVSGVFERVIVSTEDDEIAEVARNYEAEVPVMRPSELAEDSVHGIHVVFHMLDWLRDNESYTPAAVMMLLPTSPLRLASDISRAVEQFQNTDAESLVSVVDLGKYVTNLRHMDSGRLARIVPETELNPQRQGLDKVYAVNGSMFLAKPAALRAAGTFHLEGAMGFVMDAISSVDINSPDDLDMALQFFESFEPWKSIKEAAK